MKPRIAVIGSHGVGKTTLVEALADELVLPVIPESSRVVMKRRGWSSLQDTNQLGLDFQLDCLDLQSKAERAFQETGFVSDRGWPDYLAYPIALGIFKGDASRFSGYIRTLISFAKDAYDFAVYVPIEFPITFDGVRSEGVEYQELVDDMLKVSVQILNIPLITVTGSIADRVSQVLERIYE